MCHWEGYRLVKYSGRHKKPGTSIKPKSLRLYLKDETQSGSTLGMSFPKNGDKSRVDHLFGVVCEFVPGIFCQPAKDQKYLMPYKQQTAHIYLQLSRDTFFCSGNVLRVSYGAKTGHTRPQMRYFRAAKTAYFAPKKMFVIMSLCSIHIHTYIHTPNISVYTPSALHEHT